MKALRHYLAWAVGAAAPETQTTDAERSCLEKHASGRRRLVEIGVWHGVTTRLLREAMVPGGQLTAVDPFPRGRLGISFAERIAHHEVGHASGGAVRWLRVTGEAAAIGHEPIDFIFIDGDHSAEGLLGDWHAWKPLILPGGVVALHDSRSTSARRIDDAGSVKVTAEVITRDPQFEVVDVVDSLTVLQRRVP